MENQARIITFGFKHPTPPPTAHITVDLRHHFRDPHRVNKRLQGMTARDGEIRDIVLTTPGIPALVDAVAGSVTAMLSGPNPGDVVVATGCAGGRHRAPTVGEEIAQRLRDRGVAVTVEHRDIDKAVLAR